MVTINLDRIVCEGEPGQGGADIYIKYKVDGQDFDHRYPEGNDVGVNNITGGQSWDLNYPIEFSDTLVVSLYDRDTLMGSDDFLGSITFHPGEDLSSPRHFAPDGAGASFALYSHSLFSLGIV